MGNVLDTSLPFIYIEHINNEERQMKILHMYATFMYNVFNTVQTLLMKLFNIKEK